MYKIRIAKEINETMPTYKIKEKLLSLKDDFKIYDEEGNQVYKVTGKFLSIGDKLSFEDMEGNQLLYIQQKVLNVLKTYEILRGGEDGERMYNVQKKISLFKPKFSVYYNENDKLKIDGGIFEHEFKLKRDGDVVAAVTKKIVTLKDTYTVNIADGEDVEGILAVLICIDQACHDKQR